MKQARISGFLTAAGHYECKQLWPEECFVQCGNSGIVFTKKSIAESFATPLESAIEILEIQGNPENRGEEYYKTCFFEAFPLETFLRGEGKTIEEAEEKCWNAYAKILGCQSHEFERRNRQDGYAFCKHCNYSGMFLEPLD